GIEEVCAALRQWPRNVMPDYRALGEECAGQARKMFHAERAILAFSEGDEPWLTIVEADDAGVRSREQDEANYALVADEFGKGSFYAAPGEAAVHAPDATPFRIREPLLRALRTACGEGAILSIPFDSDDAQGRLFVASPQTDAQALLAAADLVGVFLSIRFEATGHALRAVQQAVTQERVRVARDLHDGLLQSFTGVVLQLETVHSTMESDPDAAKRKITETQSMIMADQRELRRFVEQLHPRATRREVPFDFLGQLEELRLRFEKQWGMQLAFDVERIEPVVGGFLGQETFKLIHEAVMNSAKHGGASDVRVGLRTAGGEMHIEVVDNGSGFPFHGRLTLDQIRESGGGPTVLAQRVHSLNGNLVVDSTDGGSTITISVPLGWGGA
ncbi:MAG TPA: histidine kinase, partial [Thermoanaerobaculia bacterium]|nr:histidine kinase [Thermoanaerobaculia bacterium]